MKNPLSRGIRSTRPRPKSRSARTGTIVIGEQPVQNVRGDAHLHRVEAPPGLVALEHRYRADVEPEPVGIDDRLCQRRRILEAEIEALPGDRVDTMRRIASQREARLDEVARQGQAERKRFPRAFNVQLAKLQAKALFELGSKTKSSSLISRSASAVRSVQTSEERLPLSGRIAKGPAGRKCSSARP